MCSSVGPVLIPLQSVAASYTNTLEYNTYYIQQNEVSYSLRTSLFLKGRAQCLFSTGLFGMGCLFDLW